MRVAGRIPVKLLADEFVLGTRAGYRMTDRGGGTFTKMAMTAHPCAPPWARNS
jgi:hypothetical protein